MSGKRQETAVEYLRAAAEWLTEATPSDEGPFLDAVAALLDAEAAEYMWGPQTLAVAAAVLGREWVAS